MGTDNGTAFTSRVFRGRLAEHGVAHRRGGYRDPEREAFIESWFSTLKRRCVSREEFETRDEARKKIAAYIIRYHHRPHSRLACGRGHLATSRRRARRPSSQSHRPR